MNNWLPGYPYIKDGILVSPKYDWQRDDTLYYSVYEYPHMSYIGDFNASRFGGSVLQFNTYNTHQYLRQKLNPNLTIGENNQIKGYGAQIGEFIVCQDIYPPITDNKYVLMKIHCYLWGLIPRESSTEVFYFSLIPREEIPPFETIAKDCEEQYYKKLTEFSYD